MHALTIRHVAFEDLSAWDPALRRRGWTNTYHDAGVTPLSTHDPLGPDLLIVQGGPLGVYDAPDYPLIGEEIDFIATRLARGLPTIGVCFGAQLLAAAAGARVYQAETAEIGVLPISLTEAGRASCLAPFDEEPLTLQWHGDTFDLPPGATLLASSALTKHQAYSLGPRILGVQFHPEWGRDPLEPWLIGHLGDLRANRIDVTAFRAKAELVRPALAAKADRVLTRFLVDAGLGG